MDLNKQDYDLILTSLTNEWNSLRNLMNDLARRGLHMGNQQVLMQQRMNDVSELMHKIAHQRSSLTDG